MGRPEKPLDVGTGPVAAFAKDLRALRHRAGNPSYRELARTALFVPSVLSSAASGHRLPTLPVTLAFVAACGGDLAQWERRWREVASVLGRVAVPAGGRETAMLTATVAGPRLTGSARPQPPRQEASTHLAHPAQLPTGPSVFAGRNRALAGAAQAIRHAGAVKTPLVISGVVGAGKTAFALRLADDVLAAFPDGQLYADLGGRGPGRQGPGGVIRGFLHSLGVPPQLVPDDPAQRIGLYRSLLAQRRLFVLLENAGDETQVRPLLGRAPHSQVVVTSRARLLGLDGTHRIDLGPFARQESAALIGALAGQDRVRAEADAADALAAECGDLPLAVAIVGRKIAARPEWSLAYLAGLLADSEHLLDHLCVGDVTVRDRFLTAYQALPPPGRRALHEFGRGARWATAIGLAAAMAISIDTADELLESLVDSGLLTRASVASRYHVPPLVSAFAAAVGRDAARVTTLPLPRQPQRRPRCRSTRRA